MKTLTKVLYRKFLQDAAEIRAGFNAPPARCHVTGLRFNKQTRVTQYWEIMNRLQALRVEG